MELWYRGTSEDPSVEGLRSRMVKNFLAVTLLSIGTPMLLMGDEIRRTQRGNNNGYCQDNEISWLDWSLLKRHSDIHRFVKMLIEIRRGQTEGPLPDLTLNQLVAQARIECHGVRLHQPDLSDQSHSLAVTASSVRGGLDLHLALNAYWEPLSFELPPTANNSAAPWRRWLDTFLEQPFGICTFYRAPVIAGPFYLVQPRSVVALARISVWLPQ